MVTMEMHHLWCSTHQIGWFFKLFNCRQFAIFFSISISDLLWMTISSQFQLISSVRFLIDRTFNNSYKDANVRQKKNQMKFPLALFRRTFQLTQHSFVLSFSFSQTFCAYLFNRIGWSVSHFWACCNTSRWSIELVWWYNQLDLWITCKYFAWSSGKNRTNGQKWWQHNCNGESYGKWCWLGHNNE